MTEPRTAVVPRFDRRRFLLRSIAALSLLGAALWYLSRQADPAALRAALAGADYRLVLLMAGGHLGVLVSLKAWRWRVMLAPVRRLPFTTLYPYVLAGYAVGNLFPARAGQAARVLLLRRHAVPVAGAVGVLVVEEICNAAILGVIALPLPFLLALPAPMHVSLGVVSGGATIALAFLVALAVAGRARGGWLRRLSEGVAILGSARTAARVLALTVTIWLVDLGQIALAMAAVSIAPSYAGVALVLLFVNLTNALPATPGQLGLFEAGATAACVAVGATAEQGLAVGILYHMMQFIPDTAIGLAVLGRGALGRAAWREPDRRGRTMRSPDLASPGSQAATPPEPRLPVTDWLRHGPFLAHLVVTRRCNLSCGYCNEYDRTSPPPVPFDVLERRLEKLHQLRTWMVCLSGGEPTVHPDLVRIVARMTHLGFPRRQLITNGFRVTPRLVEELNAAGLTDLQISIDGVRPTATTIKVLDHLRHRLEALARAGRFRTVVNAVVGSAPRSEALEVVRFAQSLGLSPRVGFLHDGSGRLRLAPEQRAELEEVNRLIGRSGREAGDYRGRLIERGEAPFRCRAGARYLYVADTGQVHWCSQTSTLFSRDLAEYTAEDLERQFHAPKPCADRCTVGCVRSASAYDAWRGQGGSAVP